MFKKLFCMLLGILLLTSSFTALAEDNNRGGEAFTAEKIMAKDSVNKTLDLELTGKVRLVEGYEVFEVVNGERVPRTLADVIVGAENIRLFWDNKDKGSEEGTNREVKWVIIEGKTPVNNMRIGIMNNGFASLEHDKIDFVSPDGFKLVDKKAEMSFDIEPGTLITIVNDNGIMKVTKGGTEIYTTTNRLYAFQANEGSKIQIMTFKRGYGNPSYRGFFEIAPSAAAGKLNIINEVQLEDYLYQVVPSEMPASFGLEALKAQAVAARTYALTDYYSTRYSARGFHVDDSTLSQVYNNSAENALTAQAVNETRGMIMECDGQLVDARYYSTSGGYGASRHEVWSDAGTFAFPGTPAPYLTGRSYTFDPADNTKMFTIDTSSEEQISAFYKNLSYTGYDSASLYFRWKVGLTKQQLENTISKNILLRYAADPLFILTKDESGAFVSRPIPAEGVGTIKDMYVAKRGLGGNIMELVIEGSTGTYKLIKEYNIRFTIRPNRTDAKADTDIIAYRAKGGSTDYDPSGNLKNPSILYSAFFTFDIERDANGEMLNVTFYGGGNGHGVGMSQYGAQMLGLTYGWTYDQILNSYYAGMQMVDVYSGQ